MLAAFTGARRAQLLGLRWQIVHLAARRMSFSAARVEEPRRPVLAAQRRDAHLAEGFVSSDDGGATAWRPNRVTHAFLRRRRAARLRPFRLHDLRHVMATEMLHAGVPLVIVSRCLEIRRLSTTINKYTHAVPG